MAKPRTGNFGKDWNEFYRIHTPEVTPLPFGGFYRLAAKAECVKCGKDFIQVLRIHRVQLGSFLSDTAITKPIPSDEKIMTTFMIRACENGVGCWKVCRPWTHIKPCQMPSQRFLLAHDPHTCACKPGKECTCPAGCGNKGIHPCQCGRMFGPHGKHRAACPVGAYNRTSAFSVDFIRSQLMAPRGRA